jgi:hypothetical protein
MGTNPYFTLPVTATSSFPQSFNGHVYILDNGTAEFVGNMLHRSPTTTEPTVTNTSGTYAAFTRFTATAPMTWANNDVFVCVGSYEAA